MSCIHRGSVFVFLCSRRYHVVVIGAKQYDNELAGATFPTTLVAATGPKKCPLSRVVYCLYHWELATLRLGVKLMELSPRGRATDPGMNRPAHIM